jgi:hypothetical protein
VFLIDWEPLATSQVIVVGTVSRLLGANRVTRCSYGENDAMPKKFSVGKPLEEKELFASEAWQKASAEQRRAFISKVRATKRIEVEAIKEKASLQKRKELFAARPPNKNGTPKSKKQTKAKAKQPFNNQQTANIDVSTNEFLLTYEWRKVRMVVLKKYGARCQCCGATPATGAVIHVDHIKPRKLFPHLALSINNLQVLCHECNHGKGNWDTTDWRNSK